jgi:hypothetical protein
MKKKEEVRKMLSKQRYILQTIPTKNSNSFFSMQELNEHDYHDGGGGGHSPYNQRRIEQVYKT